MNYISEVSDLFRSRCDNIAILSPEDYRLIAEWEKEEIPFEIIAATINDICDGRTGGHEDIESIMYFQEAIRKSFRNWLKTEPA